MLLSLTGAIALVWAGFYTTGIFYLSATMVFLATLFAFAKLPQLTSRLLLLPILRSRYRFVVHGIENIPQSGGVLLLGNHISWIDWLVLQAASPRSIKFVMDKDIYERSRAKWLLKRLNMIPISGRFGKSAIEEVRRRLNDSEVIALFPEGRISYNGQLGEFKRGFELIMREMECPIVPFYIHGLWGSTFSRANKHYKIISKYGARRDVGVYFGKTMSADSTAYDLKQAVKSLSIGAWEESVGRMKPIHYHWLNRCKEKPFRKSMSDSSGVSMRRVETLATVLILTSRFSKSLKDQKNIGVMLPASVFGGLVNMALLVMGKRAVNLNYSLPASSVASALEQADIETIVSSRTFVRKLASRGLDPAAGSKAKTIYLEDIFKDVDRYDKWLYFATALLIPGRLVAKLFFEDVSIEETATILFSSGSESRPKGIELSHKNILGNIKQIGAMLNFQDDDTILNSLPIFHSFGLTVTLFMPLAEGIPCVSVPDPTDAYSLGKMALRHKATIMFGTSTFYRIYTRNKKLHPLMLSSVRMAVAGAEKLDKDTAEAFREKFGVKLYEGYGATETSPVISVNMPDMMDPDTFKVIAGEKRGSVGQALPGTVIRICDPDSMEELPLGSDGMIVVGGIQVMKGYLGDPEKTERAIREIDGLRYYLTGDKGHLDEDGFIYIVDRYSRFVKIGGEMISLSSVETAAIAATDGKYELMAISVPDKKKGESIVLLYSGDSTEEEFSIRLKESEMPPIMRPSKIYRVDEIPKLASGKADYSTAKEMIIPVPGKE